MGERGVAGGVNGCVERCPERVWSVFSYKKGITGEKSELITHSSEKLRIGFFFFHGVTKTEL